MWKKATKIILYAFIIIGALGTILGSILYGCMTFILWDSLALMAKLPEMETIAMFLAIISGIITIIIGAIITFIGAAGMGLILEIAEDISKIEKNTRQQEIYQPIQESEEFDYIKQEPDYTRFQPK